jgi:hypothetical protein
LLGWAGELDRDVARRWVVALVKLIKENVRKKSDVIGD